MSLGKKAFTLVEVALAAALMALVGLVIFKTFSSGMRLWQRQNEGALARATAFFFERMQRDAENSCFYGVWAPAGNATQIEFPAYAASMPLQEARVPAPARVLYAWDEAAGEVTRAVFSLTDDFQGTVTSGRPVLVHIERFVLAYYFLDPSKKEYVWSQQWPPEDVALKERVWPLAVRLEVSLRDEKNVYDAVKIITLPLGG